tara:strand:+ start:1480 stop:3381 length:1902 start_codon:yes stop_codon:yes gene_type:complete
MKIPKASAMKTKLELFDNDKNRFSRTWDLCLLYLQGRQHLYYDKTTNDFRRTGQSASNVTINLLINIYRNIESRLAINYPSLTVLPASPSPDDVIKAQTSEAALRYYWAKEGMASVFEEAISWMITCGNVGLYTRYTGKDVCSEAIDPYRLYFEPGTTRLSDSNYRAYSKLVNRDELEEAYPEFKDTIKKAAEGDYTNVLRNSFGLTPQEKLKDRLKIYEIFFGNNERRVLLGSTYLFKGKWVGSVNPLQMITYTDIPGRLWGLGCLEPLIDLQSQYNRGRAQVMENADLIGNPKWLIPKTAGVGPNAITNRRGEKVYYNPAGGAPTAVTPPSLPGFVLQNISQIASEMMDVSGIHATSLGKRAIGVTSGKAIQELSNKDATQLQTTQANIEKAAADLGTVVLTLMKQYYSEGKMTRMMDSFGKVIFQYLHKTNIVEDPEVFIEAGSLFRNEKQDRDQKIIDMLQLGLIDKETALTEMQFGTGNAFVTKKLEAMAHANDILQAAVLGHQIEIFTTDDLPAFSEVFSNFVRSPDYYQLPPERQEYIRDVLVSVETFGKPEAQFVEEMVNDRVFPRTTKDPAQAADQVIAMDSPVAALQQSQEFSKLNSLKIARQMMDGEANPEQGVRRTDMGGG